MDVSETNHVKKRFLKMFLTEDEILMGKKILIKISVRDIY